MIKTTSLELSKALKEAGIEIDSELSWVKTEGYWPRVLHRPQDGWYEDGENKDLNNCKKIYPSPTVDELLEILPMTISINRDPFDKKYEVCYQKGSSFTIKKDGVLANALASLAIELKKQGII